MVLGYYRKGPMAQRKQTAFHHGNLREALIAASLKILDDEGADAVTIREVARRVGVSHAAPINHFKTRKILLTAVSSRLFANLRSELTLAANGDGLSHTEKVNTFAKALIRFGLAQPNRYQLLWRWDIVEQQDAALLERMDGIYDDLLGLIGRAWPASKFDTDTIAISVWSTVHGYVSLRLGGIFEPAQDVNLNLPREDAVLNLLIGGIGDG